MANRRIEINSNSSRGSGVITTKPDLLNKTKFH